MWYFIRKKIFPHYYWYAEIQLVFLWRLRHGTPQRSERSHPTSEVRGSSREEPGGATPCSTPEARGGSWEEQPTPEARGGDERSYPELWSVQEGLEELSHIEGQEGRR